MTKEDDDDPKLLTTGDLEWRPGEAGCHSRQSQRFFFDS